MKTTSTCIVVLALSMMSAAQAAPKKPCQSMMNEIRSGKAQKERVTKDAYSFAKDALEHYRSENMGGYNNHPHIENLYTYMGEHEEVTGYKMDLTDGGDESTTTYYFNSAGKIVYARYSNQSPVKYWFCGQKTALEIQE